MKKILKFLIFVWIIFTIFSIFDANSANLNIEWVDKIKETSIKIESSWNIVNDVNDIWLRIMKIIKLVFEWVLIIYIVYIWIEMIMSMWTDDTSLSKAKTSIRYSILALVFINIPSALYSAFRQDNYWTIDSKIWYSSWFATPWSSTNNVLINVFNFWETLNWDIIWFIEIWLSAITIFLIIIYWIKIILSNWKEEELTKAVTKITWSVWWLIFIWFIEAWKKFVFNWKISDWANLFSTFSNLALFFAWPVAISFLTIAAYYYITSNWNEDKVKKAKSIVVNTVIATVILLASYTFLLDLATL